MPAGEEAVLGRLWLSVVSVAIAWCCAGLGCGGASSAIVVGGGCVQKPDLLPAECGEDRPKVRRKGLERLKGKRGSTTMGKRTSKKAPPAKAEVVRVLPTATTTPNYLRKMTRLHWMVIIGPFALFAAVMLVQVTLTLLIGALTNSRNDANPFYGSYDDEPFVQAHQRLDDALAYKVLVRTMSRFVKEQGYDLRSKSVMDVGCGKGRLVEAWRNAGVTESYGVDWPSDVVVPMWPASFQDKYYRVVDLDVLLHPTMQSSVKATDFVTSFEVASNLQPEKAARFVDLLTKHTPRLVFFGASTHLQTLGNMPQHINEQPFDYWIDLFAGRGYHVDWASSAQAKLALMSLDDRNEILAIGNSWWYPKNMLIFAPDYRRADSDQALMQVPSSFNILDPKLLYWAGRGNNFGNLWERDLRVFGRLFKEALNRVQLQNSLYEF